MFTDNHRADENLALAARELASRGGAVAPSKATFVLRDPGNSDGAAEPTSREPALESVVVTLDRRIAEDVATGEADVIGCLAAGSITLTGPLSQAVAVMAAWSELTDTYRGLHPRVFGEEEILAMTGVEGDRVVVSDLGSGFPDVLEDLVPDQMLATALAIAMLPAEARSAAMLRLHGYFTAGTLSSDRIQRLALSLADLATGESDHERSRAEVRPKSWDPDVDGPHIEIRSTEQ